MANLRLQYEVVVVGAGPAGIAAACVAAENGRQVAMVDNSPWLGGQIWRGAEAHRKPALAIQWIDRLRKSGVKIVSNASVFAAPSPNILLAETPAAVMELCWKKLILATGARELFLPFPGWTLPGVMGPGGGGPLLLAVADGLKQAGARISLIAEQTDWSRVMRFGMGLLRYPGKLVQGVGVKARLLGVPYRCGCWPVKAEGNGRVQSVTLTNGSRSWSEDCDYLACGFHLVPNIELPRLLGCAISQGVVRVDEFQLTSVPDVFCAGEPTGVGGAECALAEGQVAGLAATEARDQARALFGQRAAWHRFRAGLNQAFALRPELRQLATPDTFVCRCEDVRLSDLKGPEGFRAAKLHTRCGMGSCQGRTCGAALQFLFGWENDSIRPPLFPVRLTSLAGELPHMDKDISETYNSLHL
ncbi:MAG: FAD-dependent oxidoreductase [Verrucomicrobia bacterium]|nr:FAD-dependent oxidoreductase [Verrucomicrobiota bacterium]